MSCKEELSTTLAYNPFALDSESKSDSESDSPPPEPLQLVRQNAVNLTSERQNTLNITSEQQHKNDAPR